MYGTISPSTSLLHLLLALLLVHHWPLTGGRGAGIIPMVVLSAASEAASEVQEEGNLGSLHGSKNRPAAADDVAALRAERDNHLDQLQHELAELQTAWETHSSYYSLQQKAAKQRGRERSLSGEPPFDSNKPDDQQSWWQQLNELETWWEERVVKCVYKVAQLQNAWRAVAQRHSELLEQPNGEEMEAKEEWGKDLHSTLQDMKSHYREHLHAFQHALALLQHVWMVYGMEAERMQTFSEEVTKPLLMQQHLCNPHCDQAITDRVDAQLRVLIQKMASIEQLRETVAKAQEDVFEVWQERMSALVESAKRENDLVDAIIQRKEVVVAGGESAMATNQRHEHEEL